MFVIRYGIALAIAALLIGVAEAFVRFEANRIEHHMRQRWKDDQAAGRTPKDVDLDHSNFADFGAELPASEMLWISLLDTFCFLRIVLYPTAILGSLAIARILASKPQS